MPLLLESVLQLAPRITALRELDSNLFKLRLCVNQILLKSPKVEKLFEAIIAHCRPHRFLVLHELGLEFFLASF